MAIKAISLASEEAGYVTGQGVLASGGNYFLYDYGDPRATPSQAIARPSGTGVAPEIGRPACETGSGVKLAFSWPGAPTDNPFVEAFNARFRGSA
jgi:hypothetical protein